MSFIITHLKMSRGRMHLHQFSVLSLPGKKIFIKCYDKAGFGLQYIKSLHLYMFLLKRGAKYTRGTFKLKDQK